MVNRCICSNISFEEVKKLAAEKNFNSVEELQLNRVCCRHCELCRPYVEEMLRTGETSFNPGHVSNQKNNGRNSL